MKNRNSKQPEFLITNGYNSFLKTICNDKGELFAEWTSDPAEANRFSSRYEARSYKNEFDIGTETAKVEQL